MTNYVPPNQQRSLRACMVCSVIQLHSRFLHSGCPNCEEFLGLAGNAEAIQDCTSQVYDGVVTLTDPRASWVAKWQRLTDYVPGIYAVRVTGVLPDDVVTAVEAAGVKYLPRDGSSLDDEGT